MTITPTNYMQSYDIPSYTNFA